MIPSPPPGTPQAKSRVYRNLTPFPSMLRMIPDVGDLLADPQQQLRELQMEMDRTLPEVVLGPVASTKGRSLGT